MKKNNLENITEKAIREDPYCYTLTEMAAVMGEDEAKAFFYSLYNEKPKAKYQTVKIKEVFNGSDTRKYAFELSDGYCIETVCIRRKTGTTVCVSTMVGCPVGCIFCASGKNGFIRNLTASEIVQQVTLLKEKVNRIVFMGMGEPLFNYDSLIKSIHILRDRNGLNFPTDGINISTVGPVAQLRKLREEHLKIQLTLSLHATNQTTRNMVMPHMRGNDINEVVEAVLSYSERHNRKITVAYLLIPGVNDGPANVRQLAKWFRNKNVLINVLQYNETDCNKIKRPNKQQLVAFKLKLEAAGLEVKLRESRGNKIKAACGQLVSKYNKVDKADTKSQGRISSDCRNNIGTGNSSTKSADDVKPSSHKPFVKPKKERTPKKKK